MAQSTIYSATRDRWVIYYPEMAYFAPNFRKLSSTRQHDLLFYEHRSKLLLLALYFDLILIPPEHFVRTFFGAKLFNDSRLRHLFDSGIIVTTYWDQFSDAKSFLEGLEEYLAAIGQNHVLSIESSRQLPLLTWFLRDVTGQSGWLRKEILRFVETNKERIINIYHPSIFNKLITIIKKSNYKDIIPFSHEKFLMLLNKDNDIPYELKEQVINKSCSLYYDAGAIGNYCIRYPIFEIDKDDLQYLKFERIYSVFFHPEFLKIFLLACGIANDEVINLPYLLGSDILYLRNKSKEAWNSFRKLYFGLAKSISSQIDDIEVEHNISLRSYPLSIDNIRNILRKGLLYNSTTNIDVVSQLVFIILEIVSAITQIPLLSYVAEHLKIYEKIENVLISFKHGTAKYFIELLKDQLQNAEQKI